MGVLKWLCLCVCPPGFPRSPVGKVRLQCDAGDAVRPLGREDPLERERAAGTGVLAWETPLTGDWRATDHVAEEWTRLSH